MTTANNGLRRVIVILNLVSLLMVVALCVLVDLNGDIMGLNHGLSIVVQVNAFVVAFVCAALLAAKFRGLLRVAGLACLLFYLAMLAPLFF